MTIQSKSYILNLSIQTAVPCAAVLIGLNICRSAWLAILIYHILIIFYLTKQPKKYLKNIYKGWSLKWFMMLVLPILLMMPLVLLFAKTIFLNNIDMKTWLAQRGLSGVSLIIFLFYYVLINPPLEELYWMRLRHSPVLQYLVHTMFAGYHIIVLSSLFYWPWLCVTFFALTVISYIWSYTDIHLKGGFIPVLSHAMSDLAIAIIALKMIS